MAAQKFRGWKRSRPLYRKQAKLWYASARGVNPYDTYMRSGAYGAGNASLPYTPGMRRGEILSLRRQDIDFHRGEIQVTRTKTDEDRNIPMTDTLTRELTAHCAKVKSYYLFENPKTGKPIVDIKNAFGSACEDAEIEDLWFHDLRHTAATRMGERGVDPFTIAEIIGNSDIKMTRSYTHATANAKRAAVAALEEASLKSGHKWATNKNSDQCWPL